MQNPLTDSQKLDLILGRLGAIETRLDKVETQLDKVEARLGAIETRLDKVEARLDKVETSIEEVRSELNARIDDLGAHQMMDMEVKALDKIGSLYDLNDRIEKRVILVEQRLGVIEARLSGFDGRLNNQANLEKKFNQLDDRLYALEKKTA